MTTREIEKLLHKELNEFAIQGEWFRDCPQSRDILESYGVRFK